MVWGGHRDYPRGLDLTREAIAAAEASGDRRALADALRQSALMLLNLCRVPDSDKQLQRALAIFEELGDARGVAETLDILTAVEGIRGDARSAVQRGGEALRRYRALGDRTAEATFSPTLGFWHVFAGDWSRGRTFLESSIAMATELAAPRDEAYARMALAWCCDLMGRYGRAARESQRALEVAREIGHLEWTVAALGILGGVHAHCGDAAGAQRLHEEMMRIARDLRAGIWVAAALAALGGDALMLGDLAGATRLLDEACAEAGEAMQFALPAMLGRAEIHLRRHEATAALALAREAGSASDYPVFAIESRRLEALAMAALGDASAAEAGLRTIASEAESLDTLAGAWRARLALADVLDRRGARTEAVAERAAAQAALERTAEDLPDDLRAAFMASPPWQQAGPGPG
jgi:tetratricopeptide (TPR) repeat protein